jgi:hypothetical protein
MDIFIDGKNADITLDGEKTLVEVLAGISRYLESAGFCASAVEVDGAPVYGSGIDELSGKSIGEVAALNIKTRTAAEMAADALIDIQNFARAEEEAGEEVSNFDSINAALEFLKEKETALYSIIFDKLEKHEYKLLLDELENIIEERKTELAEPVCCLRGLADKVKDVCEKLTSYPLDIQTGNDAKAARTVEECTQIMRKFFRIVLLSQFYGQSFTGVLNSETMKEFNSILSEFLAACENRDIVLSGDLAEYELSVRFSALYNAVLESIK